MEQSDLLAVEFSNALGAYYPEISSEMGLADFDSRAMLLSVDRDAQEEKFFNDWLKRLDQEIAKSTDPRFQADCQILRDWIHTQLNGFYSGRSVNEIEFFPGAKMIYQGLQGLVFPGSPEARRRAAVDRFKAYVYGDAQHRPFFEAIQEITTHRIQRLRGRKILWPSRQEVEGYLQESDAYARAVRELLNHTERDDWSYELIAFQNQMRNYNSYLRQKVLPYARREAQTPEVLYKRQLAGAGIALEPAELIRSAQTAYKQLYLDFQKQAAALAQEANLKSKDPKSVVRHLKARADRDPVDMEEVYRRAADRIDKILKTHDLISTPDVPLKIRVSLEGEEGPGVAYLQPPSFLNNKGERGELVVPLASAKVAYDDFQSPFVAIAATAHEGRPGHELQYARMIQAGMTVIRNRYAASTVNIEGWALYAEDIVLPYMEPEEKFLATQVRLWRVARAFLEPQLQLGQIQKARVRKVLVEELGFSPGFYEAELQRLEGAERGLAPGYYYSYTQILEIRDVFKRVMGEKYSLKCFHDRLLSMGLLTLPLLKERMRVDTRCD